MSKKMPNRINKRKMYFTKKKKQHAANKMISSGKKLKDQIRVTRGKLLLQKKIQQENVNGSQNRWTVRC